MASSKKKNKAANASRKQKQLQKGPFRHRDGDRRHREAMAKAVRDALALKKAMQAGEIPPLPPQE